VEKIKIVELAVAIVAAVVATVKAVTKLFEHFRKRKNGPAPA